MKLTSPAFTEGTEIPAEYTGKGANSNPPLQWSGTPMDAKSLVLLVEDLDAEPEPWTHWLVFNIPPTTTQVIAGKVPLDSVEGLANGGTHPYEGPNPKYFTGVHHYKFTLYALDALLDLPAESDKKAVLPAMEGHVIDQAVLTGICTSPAAA